MRTDAAAPPLSFDVRLVHGLRTRVLASSLMRENHPSPRRRVGLAAVAAAGCLAVLASCLPCSDEDSPRWPIEDGAYAGAQGRDAKFPGITVAIDGEDLVVRYPRGDRTVTVTLEEVRK